MTFSPVQKNVALPPKFRGPIFLLLSSLKKDDYLESDMPRNNLHQYATRYKMKLRTRKMENGKLGIWCIKPYKA